MWKWMVEVRLNKTYSETRLDGDILGIYSNR